MKKYFFNIAAILLLTFSLTGCYTVIWDPSQPQLPRSSNNEETGGYYSDPYYGGYAYYYDSAWWFDISLNASGEATVSRDGNTDISKIRNLDGGRGTAVRNIWNLFTNPPSRSSQSGSINKSNTSTNNSSRSGNSSDGSNKVRNSNGSRNTDKDKGRSR